MSGHSKWATIKRKKAVIDAKRSKIFSKYIKEITVAVCVGGPDVNANPRLRLAVANAKGVNLPKENIERAINKGKDKNSLSFSEVIYEGYAPGGVAILVECTTDNINRTVSNIRSYFTKSGSSLGTNGSVDYLFSRKGVFHIPKNEDIDEDDFTLEMIDAGADDVESEEELLVVLSPLEEFGAVQRKLEELKIEPENVSLQRIAKLTTKVDAETAKKTMNLIETLEEDDDVKSVYHNMEFTDEIIAVLK